MFVPLEFDTEWESEDEDEEEEKNDDIPSSEIQKKRFERMMKLKLPTKLERNFKVPEDLRDCIGEDNIDTFEELLSVTDGDVDFSRRYLKTEESTRMRDKMAEISRTSLKKGMTV